MDIVSVCQYVQLLDTQGTAISYYKVKTSMTQFPNSFTYN